MLQNYGKQQIKNILFLLWKYLHVERKGERETEREREREREKEAGREEGKDITMCLTTRKREEGGRMVQK